MESVSSNVKSAMTHINNCARNLDKDMFIRHLQSKLKETLTVHYTMVDQLIYENDKGYEYYKLCENLHLSLRKCKEDKRQLLNAMEVVVCKNDDLKKQIENIEEVLKPIDTRDDESINERRNDRQKIEDSDSDSLQSRRISSDPEERDDSGWNPIGRLIKNLPFANLWNSKNRAAWSLKTRKTTVPVSEAGVQTVTLAYRNTVAQTTPSVYGNAAVQTDPAATTATTAIQTDPWTRVTRVAAVQTDTPNCNATAAQTDSTVCDVVAMQTDTVTYGTVAVQTNADPRAGNRTATLTYNTFSQTDCCRAVNELTAVARNDVSNATVQTHRDDDGVSVETQTGSPVRDDIGAETIAVQTESVGAETIAVQTESVGAETIAVQTESFGAETTAVQTESVGAETIAVQTESVGAETIAVQTESVGAETTAVQTESIGAKTIAVQTESSVRDGRTTSAAVAVQTMTTDSVTRADGIGGTDSTTAVQTDLTIAGTDEAANQTDPDEAHETVGVQTEQSISCDSAAVVETRLDNSRFVIDKLTNKFGCVDDKAAVSTNNRVNLKAVLKKIDLVGFKSLRFQELSFVHQKVIDNSVTLCKKYSSLIEIAVKHLPSWQRGSIKQKHDIVHIFATLDRLMEMKNKEIDTFKIDLASEIQKRNEVEEKLLSARGKYEQLVAKDKELHDESNQKLFSVDQNFVQKYRNNRYTYDELIAGKFLENLETWKTD